MKPQNEYEPKTDQENEPKLSPTDVLGETFGAGEEERPPDVVVEN